LPLTNNSTYEGISAWIWLREREMPADFNILSVAGAMARHAAARQTVIAENIANADTPGYRAKDIEPFNKAFERSVRADGDSKIRTRTVEALGAASPNGNTVSVEDEMMRASAAKRDHEFATTIYAKSLSMLRAAMGRVR
jgi:flagellar basal-body rod protein FlgB